MSMVFGEGLASERGGEEDDDATHQLMFTPQGSSSSRHAVLRSAEERFRRGESSGCTFEEPRL